MTAVAETSAQALLLELTRLATEAGADPDRARERMAQAATWLHLEVARLTEERDEVTRALDTLNAAVAARMVVLGEPSTTGADVLSDVLDALNLGCDADTTESERERAAIVIARALDAATERGEQAERDHSGIRRDDLRAIGRSL